MARFAIIDDNNVVENIIIASESYGISMGGIWVDNCPVYIGDTYDPETGNFYRDGKEVPKIETETEKLKKQVSELESVLLEMTTISAVQEQKIQENEQAILELSMLLAGGNI